MIKRLKFFCIGFTLSLAGSTASFAQDNKVDVFIGFFSLNVTNSVNKQNTSVSGLGAYQLRYRRAISDNFDFGVGYSLYEPQVISGNSYYGLDLFAQYYPFTSASTTTSSRDGVNFQLSEKIRPMVGLSFHQRSFQGVQTSYTGFGLTVGGEYVWSPNLNIIVNLRYLKLQATSELGGSETALMTGLSFAF